MWDERYSTEEFVYGTTPNAFLVSAIDRLPRGRVLCVAEGEGRNAVYLAQAGCAVLAVDASRVGLEKARRLARERAVHIDTLVADLADFAIQPDSWDAVVSIFCHVPSAGRPHLHRQVIRTLKPGGRLLVLEFSKPGNKLLSKAYDQYSFTLLPFMGKLVTNDSDSYRYLAESIRMHPDQETLKGMMEQAGFERCDVHNLTGGIVAVHRGFKL